MIRKIFIIVFSLTMAMATHRLVANEPYYPCDLYYDVEPCCRCFFNVDLLYWRACESNLDSGFDVGEFDDSNGETIVVSSNTIKDPRFKWDIGFRLGTGCLFQNYWGVSAYWTSFKNTAKNHQKEEFCDCDSAGSSLPSIRSIHWKLDFNTVDLAVVHHFFLPCYGMNLEPFLGVRGAWINQKLHSHENSHVGVGSTEGSDSLKIFGKDREKFKGVGPFIGMQADWNLGCRFRLFGKADVGFLYGSFDVHTNAFSEASNDFECCNANRHGHACDVFADISLGVSWEYCVCDCMWLIVALSGEHHQYFDQKKFGDEGDLYFDGGTLSLSFEF